MNVKELIAHLGIPESDVLGDLEREIVGVAPLYRAKEGELTFCTKTQITQPNTIIFIRRDSTIGDFHVTWPEFAHSTYIIVDNPRLMFIRAMKVLYDRHSYDHALIIPEEYIKHHALDVKYGKNVIIWPGTIIGADGFGFERNEKGELEKFPHIGGVVIGDNVEIQANCTVDRGTLDDTIIGEGTKLDNIVHVGHNCKIGKHCFIAGGTVFGGSVTVGDYTDFGLNCVILPGITIGHHCNIGASAVVTKDVPDNMTVAGNPAREITEFKMMQQFVKEHVGILPLHYGKDK